MTNRDAYCFYVLLLKFCRAGHGRAWRKTKSVSEKDSLIDASADLDCMHTTWMHQITYLSIREIAGNLIHGISSKDLKDFEFLK